MMRLSTRLRTVEGSRGSGGGGGHVGGMMVGLEKGVERVGDVAVVILEGDSVWVAASVLNTVCPGTGRRAVER